MRRKTDNRKIMLRLVALAFIVLMVGLFPADPAFAASDSFQKAKVTGVKAAGEGFDSITVSWKPMSGASGYIVYSSKTKIGIYRQVKLVRKGSTSSAVIGNLVTGKTYYFKVSAYHSSGGKRVLTKKSKAAKATAMAKKPEIKLKTIGSTEIKVTISKRSGASGYQIYRSKSKTGSFKKIKTTSARKVAYKDDTCKGSTQYYYKVRAYKKINGKNVYSGFSAVKRAKTKATPNGNAAIYDISNIKPVKNSVLKGKRIFFLGSSVTKGKGAKNQSFVHILKKKYGISYEMSAVNGTMLSGDATNSYIIRLIDCAEFRNPPDPDYLVCQLSSNDARKGQPLGKISKSYDKKDFNTETVIGAMEYVIAYSDDTWNCPTIFYVLPKLGQTVSYRDTYIKMRKKLYELKDKWGSKLYILDMWNSAAGVYTNKDEQILCMSDDIHPTKAGYLLKYTPQFEAFFQGLLAQSLAEEMVEAEEETAPDGADAGTDAGAVSDSADSGVVPDGADSGTDADAVSDGGTY